MQYMGGKSRIATAIADIISKGGVYPHEIPGWKEPDSLSHSGCYNAEGGGVLRQPLLRIVCSGEQSAGLHKKNPQRQT